MIREIKHFIIHLRLHYQVFILSGGYLLGGLMADQMQVVQFWLQFLNVHILLYGGATAFNSYWDKDTGPVGGLKSPPSMERWMHKASLLFMVLGLIWSFSISLLYAVVFGLSVFFFWLYSTPHARWKGRPNLSLVAIGISTGVNSVLLGFLSAGGSLSQVIILSAAGAGLILLSLYPVSQIYQTETDSGRGDQTFAIWYGIKGVKKFFVITFFTGLVLICTAMFPLYKYPAAALFITGLSSGLILTLLIFGLKGDKGEYANVMNIKFFASFSFVLFLIAANAVRYGWLTAPFLRKYF